MTNIPNRRVESERAIADIRRDVAARIRPLCAGWSEEDVLELIERITQITYKYDIARTEQLAASKPRLFDGLDAAPL